MTPKADVLLLNDSCMTISGFEMKLSLKLLLQGKIGVYCYFCEGGKGGHFPGVYIDKG